MTKFIAVLALAGGVGGCALVPASMSARAVASEPSPYAQPGIQQSQYECVTDEGYGRFTPCANKN